MKLVLIIGMASVFGLSLASIASAQLTAAKDGPIVYGIIT